MTIYAGNLSSELSEMELRDAFCPFGQVSFVNLVRDRFHKAPTGFGIVGMPNELEALAAIVALNGRELKGRPLIVNEAGIRAK
jgi:RNA recognition motif-containing protein